MNVNESQNDVKARNWDRYHNNSDANLEPKITKSIPVLAAVQTWFETAKSNRMLSSSSTYNTLKSEPPYSKRFGPVPSRSLLQRFT